MACVWYCKPCFVFDVASGPSIEFCIVLYNKRVYVFMCVLSWRYMWTLGVFLNGGTAAPSPNMAVFQLLCYV